MSNMDQRRASGALVGTAIGDALGAPIEFKSYAAILQRYPRFDDLDLPTPALVTDDTQMALAVAWALSRAERPYTAATVYAELRDALVAWLQHPDNNRAPGMTCLQACLQLENGQPWYQATVAGSKGCGANMRVQAVGLIPNIDQQTRAALAQAQAAFTHGHPTALAASDLTAITIAELVAGAAPATLLDRLIDYAQAQRRSWHSAWLDPLRETWPIAIDPAEFIERGWLECLGVLERVRLALVAPDYDADPCKVTGAGWIAEEAFATALLCFLLYPDDPLRAVRRAAISSGDSDSIACLTGAFAGARHGLAAWPDKWVQRIEYADQLLRLGQMWDVVTP